MLGAASSFFPSEPVSLPSCGYYGSFSYAEMYPGLLCERFRLVRSEILERVSGHCRGEATILCIPGRAIVDVTGSSSSLASGQLEERGSEKWMGDGRAAAPREPIEARRLTNSTRLYWRWRELNEPEKKGQQPDPLPS